MSRILTAEYDEKHQSLRLPEPLAGVKDRAKLRVVVEAATDLVERPWMRLRGILSPEEGEDFARAIEEAGFGPINK